MPGFKTGINARVHEYLMKRQGQTVFVSDMMADCDGTKIQIQTAVSRCKKTYGLPIESVVSGNSYKVGVVRNLGAGHSAPKGVPTFGDHGPELIELPKGSVVKPVKRVFEEVGTARTGLVIQDTDGKLYLAQEL